MAALAVGFLAGVFNQRIADAGETPWPVDLFPYTYNSSSCGTPVDPINVLFVNHGFPAEIADQALNHGGWGFTSGGTQYFGDRESPPCHTMDQQSASGSGDMSRFHMRYYMHLEDDGSARSHANHGHFASADAHHEDVILTVWPPCHAVDGDDEQFSFPWGTVVSRGTTS